jgi:crotonobetaine/carnitine-CoA ligase
MFCGMTAVMFPRFSASEYWELVRRYGVTIIDPITPLLAMLMKKPPSADDRVHSVRTAVAVGTASLSPDDRDGFEERFGIPLHEVYGQTELAVCAVSERPDDRRKGSAGRSYGWFDISIRGEDDVALPPGAQGEIALRPRYPHTMMAQYWKRPEATVASWRNLWYHTGDVGSMDEDGYLYFGGRLAYWMRVRGENVSAYEVEMTIRQLESIDDVAVVGVPAELGDEDVKAYVIPTDPAAFEPTEVVSWCEQQLARYKVPRYIEVVGSFPRTAAKAEVERSTLRARGIGDAWDALDAAETAPSKRG